MRHAAANSRQLLPACPACLPDRLAAALAHLTVHGAHVDAAAPVAAPAFVQRQPPQRARHQRP